MAGRQITTLAGLGTPEHPHPVQAAWIEEQVNQCGYCISGWIMTGAELLARNPHPSDHEIREAFGDLICRCGTHNAAVKAVKRAAQQA
jgi:nicotinate dehydrogenase subunit A